MKHDARWHAEEAERLLDLAARHDIADRDVLALRAQGHAQLATSLVLIDDASEPTIVPFPAVAGPRLRP